MSLTTTGATINSYISRNYTNPNYYTVNTFTFTSAGQIVVSSPTYVSILVVAGGGGGGTDGGGGGGGGGVIYQPNVIIPSGTYNVSIGAGGQNMGLNNDVSGGMGGNTSVGSLYLAIGGGVGGTNHGLNSAWYPQYQLVNGGSGGGSGATDRGDYTGPGTGISGQGYNGGTGVNTCGGGGGGAGGFGSNAQSINNGIGGAGGIGFLCNITGTNTYYAGGGGGGTWSTTYGLGGLGGGGNGNLPGQAGSSNATYYGGGAGGGYYYNGGYYGYQGIVILAISSLIPGFTLNNILGNIPNWLQYKSNRYTPFYVKGFFDISGNVIVRNGHLNMIDSTISVLNGNLTLNTTNSTTGSIIGSNGNISATNITCVNNNIIINQNAYFNAKTYITGNLTTGSILTSATTDLSFNSNITVYGNVTTNQNNLIVGNMTVGILKPNSSSITTSCGAGYNIVNNALIGNTTSTLNNNVIIGGNIAPLAQDVNNSTLIGSNILRYNKSIITNVTAVGAFASTNDGIKTNSTYIGTFAGSDPSNNSSTISYNQINNTFIGGNTYAGNDADSQTSIGFECIKSVAVANIMYVGTTSTTMVCPNKLNIGPVPGSLGALNVDGNGFVLGNMYVNDISMNLNDASFSKTASINTAITNVNNCGFMITANYKGSLFAGANFGIMGGVQDASSVMVLPNCKVFLGNIFNTGVITGSNLNICIGKNGTFAGNTTNQITCPSNNGATSNVLSVAFTQGDELSIVLSPIATVSSSDTNSVLLVQIWCRYF